MNAEFNGIERRLDELIERVARLEALGEHDRAEFEKDPYLKDATERNFEVAAQCCIAICNRIIAVEETTKPADYADARRRLGELDVLAPEFAREFVRIAGFRNVLTRQYIEVDWDEVYRYFGRLDELRTFADEVKDWLKNQ